MPDHDENVVRSNATESNQNAVKSKILDTIAQEIASGQEDTKSIYSKNHFGKSVDKKND